MPLVKVDPVPFLALFLFATLLPAARASSLQGDELAAFDGYCPAGNYRAVWAEPLPGFLDGWVNLVCLNEDEQETSYWYVTPEGQVVSADEAELPVYVRPMAEDDVIATINDLPDDDVITLWLDFKYEEPEVPSLEAFGLPGGVVGSSGSATTGPDGSIESYYELNGVEVSQAEFEEWRSLFRTASRAQEAERDRLIMEQVQLSLYDLVELNQWHDWFDVDAVNSGTADIPRWKFNSSLVISLTGKQSRALLQSSADLVYVSIYYSSESSTTDGGEAVIVSEPEINTTQSEPLEVDVLLDENNTATLERSSGGSIVPPTLLTLFLFFGFRLRSRR